MIPDKVRLALCGQSNCASHQFEGVNAPVSRFPSRQTLHRDAVLDLNSFRCSASRAMLSRDPQRGYARQPAGSSHSRSLFVGNNTPDCASPDSTTRSHCRAARPSNRRFHHE